MRVQAKLSRVSYKANGKPIVEFSYDQCYHAFEGLDGIFTVSDNRGNPTTFTKDEFDKFFKILEVPDEKLTNADIELVMSALSGNPIVTSSKFADKIEKILKRHVNK